jgi:hypothetical protein
MTDSYIVAQLYDAMVQVGQQHQQGSTEAIQVLSGRLQQVLELVLHRYGTPGAGQQALEDSPPLPRYVDVSRAGVGDRLLPADPQQPSSGPILMPASARGVAKIWGSGVSDLGTGIQSHVVGGPSGAAAVSHAQTVLLSLDPGQMEAEAAASRDQLAQAVEALRQLEVAVSAAEYREELRRGDEGSRRGEQGATGSHAPPPPSWPPSAPAVVAPPVPAHSWVGGTSFTESRQGQLGTSGTAHVLGPQQDIGMAPVGRVDEVAEQLRRWCGICDDVLEEW